jgi:hypothetical protein
MSNSNSTPVAHRCRAKSPETCPYNTASSTKMKELTERQGKALAEQDYDLYASTQEQIADLKSQGLIRSLDTGKAQITLMQAASTFARHEGEYDRQALLVDDLDHQNDNNAFYGAESKLNGYAAQVEESRKRLHAAQVNYEASIANDEGSQSDDVMLDSYNTSESGAALQFLTQNSRSQSSGKTFSPNEYNDYVDSTMDNPNLSDDEKGRMISVKRRQLKQFAAENYKREYSKRVNPSSLMNKISGMFEKDGRARPDLSTPEKRDAYIGFQMKYMKNVSGSLTSLFKNLQAAPMGAKMAYQEDNTNALMSWAKDGE